MKVIRHHKERSTPKHRQRCDCGALLEVEQADCKLESDRDGDAFVFKCPCCRHEHWVDTAAWGKR